jgi:cell division protease FtsH
VWPDSEGRHPEHEPSEQSKQRIEQEVRELLESQRRRANGLLIEHRAEVEALRDLLLERKVLDRASMASVVGAPHR